jgi:sugar-specific transcriptional regulator TrmB
MEKEPIEKVLKSFGLTEKETEVYIFIAKHGVLKGRKIAEQMKTDKGQLYRILKSLQKKGLVETTLEYPTRFTAVQFENVIDSFVRSKREEVAQIEEAKKDLLSVWKKISQTEIESSLERFAVIEGNNKIHHKISQMVKETRRQLSMALAASDLLRAEQFGVFDALSKHPKKSIIQFQAIAQLSKQNLKAASALVPELGPNISLKIIDPNLGSPPFSRIVIRDEEEIVIFISDMNEQYLRDYKEVCLFTNCKRIIQAFSDVFLDLWDNSIDIEDFMVEIENGESPRKTELIKNPERARDRYYEILGSAKDEILIVTSTNGLIDLSKKRLQLEDWSKKGISIKIMAPIVNENLASAQQLLKWGEVRHIPLGYFETTIIDGHHLFQFKYETEKQKRSIDSVFFENTFYTNDFNYVQKTRNILHDLWRKTRIPSNFPLESISFLDSKNETHRCLRRVWSHEKLEMVFLPRAITERDVLNKFADVERNASENWSNTHWSDTMCFLGARAFATIHPPDQFRLPDMIFVILQDDEASTFGAENMLKVFIKSEDQNQETYQLVAHVQDNPKSMTYRKAKLAGFPGEENIILVEKNQLNIRVNGNTFFAGWTIPVPLLPTKYVLPPACILFEGYGKVRSGIFNNFLPSKRKQDIWYNNLEAFVTFFHPSSKYMGPGTEGSIDRESVQISYPPP